MGELSNTAFIFALTVRIQVTYKVLTPSVKSKTKLDFPVQPAPGLYDTKFPVNDTKEGLPIDNLTEHYQFSGSTIPGKVQVHDFPS